MKTISSKLRILAIAGVVALAAIVVQSCKKSSSTPSTPTVSSTTLAAGATVTAGTSTGFTISGTNLTNATVTCTTAGITVTNVTVTGSTTITGTITLVAAVASGTYTLTITTNNGTASASFTVTGLQLLGGFLSSDSVEHASLISYFTFNGNVNDTVGNQTGSAQGVTYIQGVRGEAYQGAAGAYATVPAAAAYAALQSFSVSVWYSLPMAAKPISGSKAAGIFFVSGDTTGSDGGEIILETDVPSATQYTNDSVPIHHGFNNIGGPAGSWMNFTMNSYDTATSNWVHIVMTYDGGSSTYTFYENGQPIAVSSAYGVSTSTTLYNGPLPLGSGSPATTLMGNLTLTAPDPPTTLFIGTWPPGLYGVSATLGSAGCFLGAIDELRVFNIALTQADVVGLFLNGSAGR